VSRDAVREPTLRAVALTDRGVAVLALLALAAVLAYCGWALDRGFEITDEAYYLLLAMHPDATQLYISAQQWATSLLWDITGSLTTFRASGFVVLVGSSVVLGLGILRVAADRGSWPQRLSVLSVSIICGLLYAITINVSPSYNLLASAGAYAAFGWMLLACGQPSGALRFASLIAAGAAVGVEFVCKPSAGVATWLLVAICALVLDGTARPRWSAVIFLGAGAVACVAALLLLQTTPGAALGAFMGGMDLFRMVQGESILTRLWRYAVEFSIHTATALKVHAFLIAAVILHAFWRRWASLVLVIAALGHVIVSADYFAYGADQYIKYMQHALILLALLVLSGWALFSTRERWLAAGLVLLPYSVAMGTGNALFSQVIVSLAPWGGLAALAGYARKNTFQGGAVSRAVLAGFVLMTSVQILVYQSKLPYNMSSSMREQDLPVSVGALGLVRVDAPTRQFVQEMDAAVASCGITPETPFLGLYNIPGAALALNAVPVITPWLNNVAQAEAVLARAPSVVSEAAIAVKMNADGSLPAFPSQMTDFPSAFRYCGEATYPYGEQRIRIWKGRIPAS
jgi:hypothetical protein